MPTIKELKDKRVKLITDARGIKDRADRETRAMTTEESANFDHAMDDAKAVGEEIARTERLEKEERWLSESAGRRSDPGQPGDNTAQRDAVEVRIGSGHNERVIECRGRRESIEYRTAFNQYLCGGFREIAETRAMQADSDVAGGFMVAPQQFAANMIKFLMNTVYIRQKAQVLPPLTQAESLGIPTLTTDVGDAEWTAEIKTGSEDSSLAVGKRELRPHPLAKRIKVSKRLLRISTMDPEALVRERLGYKFAVAEENAFMTGDGAQKPLGLFVASDNGIPTSRDVSDGNTPTSITFDGLHNAKYSLKKQYRDKAEWFFHRDACKQISKLKDGEGRYIWQPNKAAGEPDLLLNLPYNESEYAPNTFTTGLYVGVLGDLQYYQIVDALTMSVQVLLELYAETNQNGYIGRSESDGAPVLAEAFARVKLG